MTKLVAILNITPDSFSDGGEYLDPKIAQAKIQSLFNDGADYIDIGAQSTTYGAQLISPQDEIARLTPIIRDLSDYSKICIDSFNYDTISSAYDCGIKFINDVSGARDERILKLVAKDPQIKYVLMYSLVLPANRDIRAKNYDEVIEFGKSSIACLLDIGIKKEQIIFDPGLGFSADTKLSWEIINNPNRLGELDVPIYIGHSRKGFLVNDPALTPVKERDRETLRVSKKLIGKVDYLRVHNIKAHYKCD